MVAPTQLWFFGVISVLAIAGFGVATARGEDETTVPRREMPGAGMQPVQELNISYDAGSKVKFDGRSGTSDAFDSSLVLVAPIPLADRWVLPVGLNSQNLFLGTVPGTPVPGEIHTLGLTTGLGYRINDAWMVMGFLSPTLYRFRDVGLHDVGLSGGVTARWQYRSNLQFMFGLLADPDSDLPVLPIAGVDWQIDRSWDLSLMLPNPRVIYQLNNECSFFLGANTVSTTFRASEHLGSDLGRTKYNNALGTYRDIRLGGGAALKINDHVRIELEAGYSVSRQIDYTRVNETVRFDPAPYAQLGLKISF